MTFALALCCRCFGQSAEGGKAGQDAHEMVELALAQLKAGDAAKTRFTRFELLHLTNRDKKGKLTADIRELYENLWINGLAYKRLVERNGKPLQGAELKEEQARYDEAVRKRNALDTMARGQMEGRTVPSMNLQLKEAMGPNYRVSELARETVDGKPARVLVAEPNDVDGNGKPILKQRFKFWMSEGASPVLVRFEYEFLDDEPNYNRGTRGTTDYQMFDSALVARRTVVHGNLPKGNKAVTADTEYDFSRYRRFTTSVRILPASGDPNVPQ